MIKSVFLLSLVLTIPLLVNPSEANWSGIYLSIYGNWVFLLLVLYASWFFIERIRHEKMKAFFGLRNNTVTAVIGLVETPEDRGKKIPLVSFNEFKIALSIGEIFSFKLSQLGDNPPGWLSQIVFNPIEYKIAFSEYLKNDCSTILFGTRQFNKTAELVERSLNSLIQTDVNGNDEAFFFVGGNKYTDLNHSFVQRIRLKNGGFVFQIAGNSDESTSAASIYLKRNWMKLLEIHGAENDFAVILKNTPGNIFECEKLAAVMP
ncbi:MAG: hypothetical protein HQM10_05050 [Candidatus Riflebacteria bacterium]|nr:hypothetical protein [Candidatus Riflebacteria bacterium]